VRPAGETAVAGSQYGGVVREAVGQHGGGRVQLNQTSHTCASARVEIGVGKSPSNLAALFVYSFPYSFFRSFFRSCRALYDGHTFATLHMLAYLGLFVGLFALSFVLRLVARVPIRNLARAYLHALVCSSQAGM
jgi:hypothetical protein